MVHDGPRPNTVGFRPTCKCSSIDDISDDCLACVFRLLGTADRNSCSLVSRRWFKIDGRTRHSLSLTAESHLSPFVPSLFTRFNSVTQLTLKCHSYQVKSIRANTLIHISQLCRNLTLLEIHASCYLTDVGLERLAMNCKGLKRFSFGSCSFGSRGMEAFMHHCKALEELSLDGLHGANDGTVAASTLKLKAVSLKDTVLFYPFLGAKNLRVLKLLRCPGEWDRLFHLLVNEATGIVELHLVLLEISDVGLEAVAKCSNLEVLHLVKTPKCTDAGLVAVAKGCNKSLRKLHVGWELQKIGNRGLTAVAEYCVNLQQLVLIGMNLSRECFEMLVSNCEGLEQLGLCGSEMVSNIEMSCIAAKCRALRELYIEGCPISDGGLLVVFGCPKLERVKVWKCEGVDSREEYVQCGERSVYVCCDFQYLQISSPIIPDPFKEGTETRPSFMGYQGTRFRNNVSNGDLGPQLMWINLQ
ncbi:unnamed protein product [Sphenostylis stenocarpa]|uniref:Uncharacterized protein n=1 Tax=Sphenostylis stenocarpa TaxID=92480 RepID=A0AA86SV95_9FABA|nr:unnamed protein product [Sphenostylis stenocarpa]